MSQAWVSIKSLQSAITMLWITKELEVISLPLHKLCHLLIPANTENTMRTLYDEGCQTKCKPNDSEADMHMPANVTDDKNRLTLNLTIQINNTLIMTRFFLLCLQLYLFSQFLVESLSTLHRLAWAPGAQVSHPSVPRPRLWATVLNLGQRTLWRLIVKLLQQCPPHWVLFPSAIAWQANFPALESL